jgi:hypothetical protein
MHARQLAGSLDANRESKQLAAAFYKHAQSSSTLMWRLKKRPELGATITNKRGQGLREPRCSLILLRHGYSEWNEANLFTGWADPPLTSRGRDEARLAGSLLRAAGIGRIERVYSSLHERAIKTAWLLLDEMELQWVLLIASDGSVTAPERLRVREILTWI